VPHDAVERQQLGGRRLARSSAGSSARRRMRDQSTARLRVCTRLVSCRTACPRLGELGAQHAHAAHRVGGQRMTIALPPSVVERALVRVSMSGTGSQQAVVPLRPARSATVVTSKVRHGPGCGSKRRAWAVARSGSARATKRAHRSSQHTTRNTNVHDECLSIVNCARDCRRQSRAATQSSRGSRRPVRLADHGAGDAAVAADQHGGREDVTPQARAVRPSASRARQRQRHALEEARMAASDS
jgi:hypothetical protein